MKSKQKSEPQSVPENAAKRILVLTADAGYGHRSAAKAIVAALEETRGSICHIDMVNPLDDKRVLPLLRESQTDYDKLVRETPKLYELGYEATGGTVGSTVVEGALVAMLFVVMRDILHQVKPDAIITTYPLYQAPLRAVFIVENTYIPLLTVVTDLSTVHSLWFHKGIDLCMTPTEDVYAQAVDFGLKPQQIRITGIPVHPTLAVNRDTTLLRNELGWQPDKVTVLAVGSKRVSNLRETLRALNHSALPMQLVVVAGGDDAFFRHTQDINWHIDSHTYNFVTNLPDMMKASDFIICKAGGLIISESLACGLPLLLIDALPGQEKGNANYIMKHNAGDLAANALDALETTYHWLADGKKSLHDKAANARKIGHPRSAYEIADLVWDAAQNGPMRWRDSHTAQQRSLIAMLDRYRVPWQR